ncbi:MAG: hypothetical protein ABEJ68_06565 [Halobacteriaceae archaeon]
MDTRTRDRLLGSISLKVAVAGVVLIGAGAGIDVVLRPLLDAGRQAGVWAGVVGLVGLYVTLLSLVVLGVLEFLRYMGY